MWWQGFDLVRWEQAADEVPDRRHTGCGRPFRTRQQEAGFGAERRSRPSSAPALLRGEGHLSRCHAAVHPADAMGQKRQAIEELAVDLSKSGLQQEALGFRRGLQQSIAAEPCHQDLHVFHNSAVRARTAASRPSSASAVGGPSRRATAPRPHSASVVGTPPRRAAAPLPHSDRTAESAGRAGTPQQPPSDSTAHAVLRDARPRSPCGRAAPVTPDRPVGGPTSPGSASVRSAGTLRGEAGGAPRAGSPPPRREARASSPGESQGSGRRETAAQGGFGPGRGTTFAGGIAVKEACSDADQVRRLCTILHQDMKEHCNRLGIGSEILQGSSGVETLMKMRRLSRFVELARMTRKQRAFEGNANEIEANNAALTAGMTSALKKRYTAVRPRNIPEETSDDERGIPEQVPDKVALLKLAQFFAGLDMPLREALNRIAPRGERRVRLNEWSYGLALIGFTGNAAQAFRLLDAREEKVLTVKEVEANMLQLDGRLASASPAGAQLRVRTEGSAARRPSRR